jgi:hypothetical protein
MASVYQHYHVPNTLTYFTHLSHAHSPSLEAHACTRINLHVRITSCFQQTRSTASLHLQLATMASSHCAHLILIISVLILLCHLTRATLPTSSGSFAIAVVRQCHGPVPWSATAHAEAAMAKTGVVFSGEPVHGEGGVHPVLEPEGAQLPPAPCLLLRQALPSVGARRRRVFHPGVRGQAGLHASRVLVRVVAITDREGRRRRWRVQRRHGAFQGL